MIAQTFVGLSRLKARNPSSKSAAGPFNVGAMKNRFPTDRRASWRQRFLAIARESEAGSPRRDVLEILQAARRPMLAGRSLRGIRLGCIRAA